jgi:hypothetical protein
MLRCGDILKSEPADVSHTLNRAFSATRMCAGPLPGACAPALKLNRALALADRLTFRLTEFFPVGQAQRQRRDSCQPRTPLEESDTSRT